MASVLDASVLASLAAGIPCNPLPEHPGRDDSVPHAPRFSVVLNHAETRCVRCLSTRSHPSLPSSSTPYFPHAPTQAPAPCHAPTKQPYLRLPPRCRALSVRPPFRRSADLSGTGMAARRLQAPRPGRHDGRAEREGIAGGGSNGWGSGPGCLSTASSAHLRACPSACSATSSLHTPLSTPHPGSHQVPPSFVLASLRSPHRLSPNPHATPTQPPPISHYPPYHPHHTHPRPPTALSSHPRTPSHSHPHHHHPSHPSVLLCVRASL